MRSLLVALAVGAAALGSVGSASAQHFYGYGGGGYRSYSGPSVHLDLGGFHLDVGRYPVYGHGYYYRGDYDVVPGHVYPHYGHYHYVPPHVDYHYRGRRYEVIPGPFGSSYVSPYPHRH